MRGDAFMNEKGSCAIEALRKYLDEKELQKARENQER